MMLAVMVNMARSSDLPAALAASTIPIRIALPYAMSSGCPIPQNHRSAQAHRSVAVRNYNVSKYDL
eukprot:4484911-Amphidinium_carterae.1